MGVNRCEIFFLYSTRTESQVPTGHIGLCGIILFLILNKDRVTTSNKIMLKATLNPNKQTNKQLLIDTNRYWLMLDYFVSYTKQGPSHNFSHTLVYVGLFFFFYYT